MSCGCLVYALILPFNSLAQPQHVFRRFERWRARVCVCRCVEMRVNLAFPSERENSFTSVLCALNMIRYILNSMSKYLKPNLLQFQNREHKYFISNTLCRFVRIYETFILALYHVIGIQWYGYSVGHVKYSFPFYSKFLCKFRIQSRIRNKNNLSLSLSVYAYVFVFLYDICTLLTIQYTCYTST